MMRLIAERRLGWTGGQYSLLRIAFGAYLLIYFIRLVLAAMQAWPESGIAPSASDESLFSSLSLFAISDGAAFVLAILVLGAVASALLALGWNDRMAAIILLWIWTSMMGADQRIAESVSPVMRWLLLAHALMPGAPYGSLAAHGRTDPAGGWRFPTWLWATAWVIILVSFGLRSLASLFGPSVLEPSPIAGLLDSLFTNEGVDHQWWMISGVLVALLALFRVTRPWAWLAMGCTMAGDLALGANIDRGLGAMLVLLLLVNPGWVVRKSSPAVETVYYDGACGLCHRAVRFLLAEDRSDAPAFEFSPLQGRTIQQRLSASNIAALPDSIVIVTHDGRVLTRWRAVLHALARLGGVWRIIAAVGRVVPCALGDWCYDRVAAVRHRLFSSPRDVCPLVPEHLHSRFLA